LTFKNHALHFRVGSQTKKFAEGNSKAGERTYQLWGNGCVPDLKRSVSSAITCLFDRDMGKLTGSLWLAKGFSAAVKTRNTRQLSQTIKLTHYSATMFPRLPMRRVE
jgi:hypothetical protein